MGADPDETVLLPAARPNPEQPKSGYPKSEHPSSGPHPARLLPLALGAGLIAAVSAGAAWWALRPAPAPVAAATAPPPAAPPPAGTIVAVPPVSVAAPTRSALLEGPRPPDTVLPAARPDGLTRPFVGKLASEAEILADQPDTLAVYRFAPQPSVVVLQFPSLAEQANMLNRIAALIEKAGYPHYAVMSRDELDRRIIADGGTPDTFYYGHDYSAAEVVRFFSLAADPNPEEQGLLGLVRQLGWDAPGTVGALISLVRQSGGLDAAARATILRHEISHGYYFTDPAYAAFCQQFWSHVLTSNEREKFMVFLGGEGYDTALSDLMVNETQAYLMHTPDPRFFNAASVHLPQARVDELRRTFATNMPQGWLRDHTPQP